MKNNFIYLILTGIVLFTSCYKEAPIVPSEISLIDSRFEFPQGDNPWDLLAEDIHNKYGIYLIYKDIDSMDLNRSWYATSANNSGSDLTDQQAEAHMNFMSEHIFNYLSPAITKGAIKPLYYLVYNFYGYSAAAYGRAPLLNYTNGIDFWVNSIFNEATQTMPADPAKLKEYRVLTMMPILQNAYLRGNIQLSDDFFDLFDFVTPIDMYSPDSPDYYLTRGFPGKLLDDKYEFEASYMFYEGVSLYTHDYTFKVYLFLALRYSKEELEAQYPSASYPLIHTGRDTIIDLLKDTYGIDLCAIEQGPQD